MKLISEVTIKSFRSISDARLKDLGDFTAVAGLNNSGKSNLLRALNAFFSGYTEPLVPLSVDDDYFRPHLRKKKAKRISIGVRFSLPPSFRFRKGIEGVKKYLGGNEFEILKQWERSRTTPRYFLNGKEVSLEDRQKIDQFLSLVSFRYIPNRVLPLDVVRKEHQSLRDVLVRRLARRGKSDEALFNTLQTKSAELIKSLSKRVNAACPDVSDVRLATPASWREMIFAFGYKLHSGAEEMDDSAQGSGIQSYLMLETLSLIDRDYFKQFGWKQAAIWAVEEPESSLHSSLEARVADFVAGISMDPTSRLQVIATTHSDLMLQYADEAVFAEKQNEATSFVGQKDKRAVLERAAQTGISRWIHPILANPLDPVVLVEGKSDSMFLQQAVRLVRPTSRMNVCCLEELEGGKTTGGVKKMLQYVKANVAALRARIPTAPVIVVLDWDSASKKVEFEKHLKDCKACKVLVWPEATYNPTLDETFHGIERHVSDRIIDAAGNGSIATRGDGTKAIAKKDVDRFKKAVMQLFEAGITEPDIEHAKPFVEEIIKAATA